MPLRSLWSRTDLVGAGVVLAAAFGAWQAALVADVLGFGPETTARRPAAEKVVRRPAAPRASAGPGAPEGGRAPAFAAGQGRLGWDASAPAPTPTPTPTPLPGPAPLDLSSSPASAPFDDPTTPEAEAAAAEALGESLARLARDLEFTPGLPEPRQQVPRPLPTPWRPPAETEQGPEPVIEGVEPAEVPSGGGVVVIRGRNLRVAQVMFGALGARITGAGPERVTVVAPPARPGAVRVALTNDDGRFALAEAPFRYLR